MVLTNEDIDSIMGFAISEDGFFSDGTVIAIDGGAWKLIEQVGDQLVFEPSDEIEAAIANVYFFQERV